LRRVQRVNGIDSKGKACAFPNLKPLCQRQVQPERAGPFNPARAESTHFPKLGSRQQHIPRAIHDVSVRDELPKVVRVGSKPCSRTCPVRDAFEVLDEPIPNANFPETLGERADDVRETLVADRTDRSDATRDPGAAISYVTPAGEYESCMVDSRAFPLPAPDRSSRLSLSKSLTFRHRR
jgi:hypothetical protein